MINAAGIQNPLISDLTFCFDKKFCLCVTPLCLTIVEGDVDDGGLADLLEQMHVGSGSGGGGGGDSMEGDEPRLVNTADIHNWNASAVDEFAAAAFDPNASTSTFFFDGATISTAPSTDAHSRRLASDPTLAPPTDTSNASPFEMNAKSNANEELGGELGGLTLDPADIANVGGGLSLNASVGELDPLSLNLFDADGDSTMNEAHLNFGSEQFSLSANDFSQHFEQKLQQMEGVVEQQGTLADVNVSPFKPNSNFGANFPTYSDILSPDFNDFDVNGATFVSDTSNLNSNQFSSTQLPEGEEKVNDGSNEFGSNSDDDEDDIRLKSEYAPGAVTHVVGKK